MLEVMMVLYYAVVIAIAWVLVAKYRQTRDHGLFWFGGALVIWPLIRTFLVYGEKLMLNRVANGQPTGVFPFSLVEQGKITLGYLSASFSTFHYLVPSVLILVGIVSLYRHQTSAVGTNPTQKA